jgi:hypothetical protein
MIRAKDRGFLVLAVLLVLVGAAIPRRALACPFCLPGKTLTNEGASAAMVVSGTLSNADEKKNTTDIQIEAIFKDNPLRGTRKQLTLSRYYNLKLIGPNNRFLLYCHVIKGNIDPYRGVLLRDDKLPSYLRAALGVKDKPLKQRLRFFFDYLDNQDADIALDAYREFANADYTAEFRELLKEVPVERVKKWLKDPKTPPERIGLYGSIVGHAGTEKDAAFLRNLLNDPKRREGSGVDGMLAGYVMVKPSEGWSYLLASLKSTKDGFTFHYSSLRALRFLHDFRPELVARKDLSDGLCVLLKQEDVCDLAIEDLRKWKAWDRAEGVLALVDTDTYKSPMIKRAILRFCLQCKDSARAKAYVESRRKADPETVKETQEFLKREQGGR